MPSSKKTPHLRLNRWLGSDKPKKDDFNEDNDILDQVAGDLQSQITAEAAVAAEDLAAAKVQWNEALKAVCDTLPEDIGATVAASETVLRGEISASAAGLSALIATAQNATSNHTADSGIHVTSVQKTAWSNAAPIVGTYSGDNAASRKITLGYQPRAGIVFAVGEPVSKTVWSSQSCNIWSAFFSASGSGGGVSVSSDGFTVIYNSSNNLEGFAYKLNSQDTSYVYIVWK